jgi:hypothetical protein
MRTKALLGLAALAVGLSTSVAQNVYSLNVVGYVNVTLSATQPFSFLSVPLQDVNGNYCITNTINLTDPVTGADTQDFAYLFPWSGTQWLSPATWFGPGFEGTGWDTPYVISNGVGFFIQSVANSSFTFVGQVAQGTLSYKLPLGFTTLANQIPVTTNFPGATVGNDFDYIFTWSQAGQEWNSPTTYFGTDMSGNGWDWDSTGNGPILAPGIACFYQNGTAPIAFSQNFTVQ